MAQLESQVVDIHAPLKLEEAKHVIATGKYSDDAALRLVVADATRAENYESTKQWVMGWAVAAALYQSPFTARYWEGTQTERANIPFFTVATSVEYLVPQIVNGLFYETPPFIIQERPGTSAQAARAVGSVLAYQLEDIGFRKELRLGVKNAVLFGTGIWKYGWETFTKIRRVFKRKNAPLEIQNPLANAGAPPIKFNLTEDDIEEELVEEYIDRPIFEHLVNLRHILVDPGLNVPDIRKAKYIIHRQYLTWNQLDELRQRPGYSIPSREALIELFFPPKEEVEAATQEVGIRNPLWDARSEPRFEDTTDDPFNQPLEVLERWDNKSCIVVLQKKLVIANDENQYGQIPFLSIGWWDVPEAFWSLGLAKTIGSEQRLQQGITNLWLDDVALKLNGVYVRVRGKSVPTQSIRIAPGRIVEVDNKDDFKVMDRPDAVPEAGQHIVMSQARVDLQSGANPITSQGRAGDAGHSNLGRSSAGAQLLGAGANSMPADFVERLADHVILPLLYKIHEMNCQFMPVATLHYILNEELQHEFMKNEGDLLQILNARVKFSILAAAKMQSRRNMAQALPIMIQFLTNQQTENQLALQGKKVDVVEVLRMMFEVSDWKNFNDVVLDMTPEDQERWKAMQMGAQQAQLQGKMTLQQQAFNQKSALVDQENISRAGREILRQAIEHSSEPEALLGQPGGTGFGSNV